jgi:hypothetical protein
MEFEDRAAALNIGRYSFQLDVGGFDSFLK